MVSKERNRAGGCCFVAAMLEDAGVEHYRCFRGLLAISSKRRSSRVLAPAAAVVKNHVNIPVLGAGGITDHILLSDSAGEENGPGGNLKGWAPLQRIQSG